ncbi:NAD(P)H-dependent glycerol-3-phosphate dehydrogenase [Desulfobulbus alkaliphilus]|uniref:NAD(P)H-dependent glycerol-3-phosphate dehydrogenase n=1 Tax=Desulfobulbus alkaliphilus TaxID=869814 RepID=UPI0035325F60
MINKTAVIGAGSWGTALALLLARKGLDVTLWGRDSAHINRLAAERENKKYLPGYRLPDPLVITDDLIAAVAGAQCVVMVVPSHGYRQVYRAMFPGLEDRALLVSAVKGIELDGGMTMTAVMREESRDAKSLLFGVLSGPSFAEEVAAEQPTAVTVAFADLAAAEAVQHLFSSSYFRVYSASDVVGLEISGAMKNVIAIAAGICDGLHFGLNTRAALITRGLAEISRLGAALGAQPLTFAGLGGLGDLVLTCTGNLSRNRTVGLKLGSGLSLPEALAEMSMVAEGVKTTQSCYHLAQKLQVDMPILEQVYQVLYSHKKCEDAVHDLFQRDLKQEDA